MSSPINARISKDPWSARACPCFSGVGDFRLAGVEAMLSMSEKVGEKAGAEFATMSSSADSRLFAEASDGPYHVPWGSIDTRILSAI